VLTELGNKIAAIGVVLIESKGGFGRRSRERGMESMFIRSKPQGIDRAVSGRPHEQTSASGSLLERCSGIGPVNPQ
jgi:hypothetical protein